MKKESLEYFNKAKGLSEGNGHKRAVDRCNYSIRIISGVLEKRHDNN